VRERLPDRVLEAADEIVVVDVTPETLEERLLEGKIYAPKKLNNL
jgi:two-component system sensor histidine kinase KdpD